ncbi:MAG: CoB--CoM heterodisulfide reductase iron-sulfur subunit A family protein [Methanomassiliicoccales archaeon]|jgi:heterodisulfide reductase subunit A-like polyferredoxin|nr:CoB--CoM heterodisulfide reductase iron-sulfur subunit A family protein [Methanomassiliicoccales archaeon]
MDVDSFGKVLVVGGGVAGLQTALDLSRANVEVFLVEKEMLLGGTVAKLHKLFPSMESGSSMIKRLTDEIHSRSEVLIHTNTVVSNIRRNSNRFHITLSSRERGHPKQEIEADAIVLATGLVPVDLALFPEYGYGRYCEVMSSIEFERLLVEEERKGEDIFNGQDGNYNKTIAFVQCAGSRTERSGGVPYCSAVCCMNAIKNAISVKELHPDSDVWIFYIDIRVHATYGEEMYRKAKRLGVKFVRGQPSLILKKEQFRKVIVCGENTLLRELYEIPADIVVLSAGLRHPESSLELFRMLNLPISADGFPLNLKDSFEPCVTSVDGIFIVGSAESPKDVHSTITQGRACAMKILERFMS